MAILWAIWKKIYPNDDEHRWMPLIWLPFTIWFFVDPLSRHPSLAVWLINTLLGIIFILLYLQAFSRPDPYRLGSCIGHDGIGRNPDPI